MSCANRAIAVGFALALGVTVAACGEGTDAATGAPPSSSSSAATTTGVRAEPVLRIFRTGGFTASHRTRWLGMVLYADGRVVLPAAVSPGADAPAYQGLTRSQMPAADVTALVREAKRVVRPDVSYDGVTTLPGGGGMTVSDAQTTWVQRWEEGREVRTGAYALDESPSEDSRALAAFVHEAERKAQALPVEGEVMPAALEVWARPSLELHPRPAGAPGPDTRDWPGNPLAPGKGRTGTAEELTCEVETDPAAVLDAVGHATSSTAWNSGGQWFAVEVVPLLPGETGCVTDTPADPR